MSSPAQGYHSEATTTVSWKAECALWIKEQLEDGALTMKGTISLQHIQDHFLNSRSADSQFILQQLVTNFGLSEGRGVMELHKELEEAAQFDDLDGNNDGVLTLRQYF